MINLFNLYLIYKIQIILHSTVVSKYRCTCNTAVSYTHLAILNPCPGGIHCISIGCNRVLVHAALCIKAIAFSLSLIHISLDHAGKSIAELLASGNEFDSICIPVSPILLVQEDFIDQVKRVIETYRIPEGKLALEVDDTALSSVYLNVNITCLLYTSVGFLLA